MLSHTGDNLIGHRWFSLPLAILLWCTVGVGTLHASDGIHVVQRGESLSTIARFYNVSMAELAGYNGISNQDFVWIGQQLRIPAADTPVTASASPAGPLPGREGYHVVRRGEMLSYIARSYGMDVQDLMRLNGLTNPNVILVGQTLRVSARAQAMASEVGEPRIAGQVHTVQPGESLSQIAQEYGTTVYELMNQNGLPNPNHVWSGQRLRIPTSISSLGLAAAPADGYRWIEVDLSRQTLTAWQGDVAVLHTSISSGLPGTPTVTGRFRIGTKYTNQRMIGPGYDLPNVPWVMYFHGEYAIHGTYWHNNFGMPMSHGCVNMRSGEAQLLFDWASPGTEVVVRY